MMIENDYKPYRKEYTVPEKKNIPKELFGLLEFASLLTKIPELIKLPKSGNGEIVLVLPGYGADDTIMSPLRKFLNFLGYDSRGWGLGENRGDVPFLLEEVKKLILKHYSESNNKIIIIGWSLGGYIGREAARDYQNKVEKVITLGSPIIGGPKYTAIGDFYSKMHKVDMEVLEKEIDKRFENTLLLPLYSIYSKKDSIVSWQACIDKYSPNVTNQEVNSTHLGLIGNYEVYKLIAEYLAR